MKILKYLFELIFVFLLPILFIFISFKYDTINNYDSSGNLISSEKVLDYSDNSILRDFNDNQPYINHFHYNQLLLNGNFNNGRSQWGYWSQLSTFIVLDDGLEVVSSGVSCSLSQEINENINNHKILVTIKAYSTNSTGIISVNFIGDDYKSLGSLSSTPQIYQIIYDLDTINNYNRIQFTLSGEEGISFVANYCMVTDLTDMFGSGFEPVSVSELNSIFDTTNFIDYTDDFIFDYISFNQLSYDYSYNYTWYANFFNNFFEDLQFNNNSFVKLIVIYLVLTIIFFFFWNLIYWPLSLIFRLLLWKKTYY